MPEIVMPWQWLLLGLLEEAGGQAPLQLIYLEIEKQYDDISKEGETIIKPSLLDEDPRFGERPKYTHTVRGLLSDYTKKGWVERVSRGEYRITEAGRERLKWHQG